MKGGSEGLGLSQMIARCEPQVGLELKTDASAAVGVCSRSGAGRVKHLSIKQLWLQSLLAEGRLALSKIPRAVNVSELLAHHCSVSEMQIHLCGVGALRHGPHENR